MDGRGAYPPGPASGAGLRYGELRRGNQIISGAICLVTEAGELGCILEDHSSYVRRFLGPYEVRSGTVVGAMHGQIRVVDSDEIKGSGKLYAAPGKVLRDGVSAVADFSITAGLLSDLNRALELTIESVGEVTTLSLTGWDRYYFGDSSLTGVSAVYPIFDIFGDPGTVSIDANGALFSQAASGCVISGQVVNHRRDGQPLCGEPRGEQLLDLEWRIPRLRHRSRNPA